ncbi:MAG: N-acetylglucosamine-6-phosphate deacetylase, partial [Clostridia bacterium]
MIIKNGTVLTDDFKFVKTDLKLENTCVSEFGSFCGDGFDADGMFVLPGFIDTHVHGANNVEFASADANFDDALMYEARHGITAIAPTTRCLPLDDIYAAFDNIVRESQKRKGGAKILGIHAEGPFVSPLKKGA